MDPSFPGKEEHPPWQQAISDRGQGTTEMGQPRAIEGLHEMGPPPFLTKTYDMVDDPKTNHIVSWSRGGQSFVVWDLHSFCTSVVPNYFKHNNFSSFVRQLNTYLSSVRNYMPEIVSGSEYAKILDEDLRDKFYKIMKPFMKNHTNNQLLKGFRKIDTDKWEFANEAFLRGQKHLLKNIRRRKTPSQSLPPQQDQAEPCVEVGSFGEDGEIDRLRRDKHVLMMEIVKLRLQQENTRASLKHIDLKLQGTERKQQQMMSFLARAMQNPEFIHQLVQHKEKRKELDEAVSKKRHRPIEYGESSRTNKGKNPIKAEPLEFGESDPYYQVSELEALALEMQGFSKAKWEQEDRDDEEGELTQLGSNDKELDDGFWEELLSERLDQEPGIQEIDEEEGGGGGGCEFLGGSVGVLGLEAQLMLWFWDKKSF